jgi:hypothetical protein
MNKGPVSQFILHHYRHFNAAALIDAAKGYETHLLEGGKMMVTLAWCHEYCRAWFIARRNDTPG